MYLLIYRNKTHLFSFYLNSAKKKIVIGGAEGDILFPDEMKGNKLLMRKEFNFELRQYMWALHPSSDGLYWQT